MIRMYQCMYVFIYFCCLRVWSKLTFLVFAHLDEGVESIPEVRAPIHQITPIDNVILGVIIRRRDLQLNVNSKPSGEGAWYS
jgi:hypothetical protein